MQFSKKLTPGSLYIIPNPAQEITPTPPWFATAEAKPESEMPTPIPPCTIGVGMKRPSIFNGLKFVIFY